MPLSHPTDILLAHNKWATRQMIDVCEKLSPAQRQHPFETGPGSLYATLVHILGAMRGWSDLLAGREQRPRLETEQPEFSTLAGLLDEIAADLETHAKAHPLDEIVTGSRGGREYSFLRGAVITHVTTHGIHHRAQMLNMLRQLGVDPLPPSSVMEWTFLVDPVR